MPRPTFPLDIPPKFSPDNEETVRNTVVQFGDGYDLVVGDGLNTIRATKSLEWEPITYQQMATMLSFLRSRSGDWFYYIMDEDAARRRKFMCDRWRYGRVRDTLDLWYFKAEFKEVFRTET
jgi:phage-related protein